MAFKVPENCRVRRGEAATSLEEHGLNGMFMLPNYVRGQKAHPPLKVIATDGSADHFIGVTQQWEHVSVSLPHRCPTWDEMCRVKGVFWDDEDTVMQLHPPHSEWVSNHPFCLHLWRPVGVELLRPPSIMVGIKDAGNITTLNGGR